MSIVDALKQKTDLLHGKGISESRITDAEKKLGLRFSKVYRDYLLHFGVAEYDMHELAGITDNPRNDVVYLTTRERNANNSVPNDMYVIEYAGMDGIVIWQSESGEIFQTVGKSAPCKICDSFEEYIER